MKKALIALLMGLMALPAIATNTNSIVENLQELIETRDAITNAIVQKGGTVTSGALTNVPNEILSIPSGGGGGGPFAALVDRSITMVTGQDLDGVTGIGDCAFSGCSELTSITIPDSVRSIGERAFEGCSGLTSITIPDSVRSIGEYAFSGCSGLTSVTIPDSVTIIGDSAFNGCSGLTSVTIGTGATSIGSYTFANCSGLMWVTIGNGVMSIEDSAFEDCSSLESIEFPPTLTSIGNYAFNGCSGLFGIRMPDDIANIGSGAFYGCTNLAMVEFPPVMNAVPELYNSDAFSGLPNNYQIWVSGERLADWKIKENWIDLASHIYPEQAINEGMCVSEGNGMSRVVGVDGTFDADAAFNLDDEGQTLFSENSTLWIGDSVNAIDDSRFESDIGGPMYYDGGNDGCWGYLKFCNIPQEEVETWRGYPWGFPTNRISYLSRPE